MSEGRREGEKDRGREGGREGGRGRKREGGREGGGEKESERVKEGGREGRRERGREGRREGEGGGREGEHPEQNYHNDREGKVTQSSQIGRDSNP